MTTREDKAAYSLAAREAESSSVLLTLIQRAATEEGFSIEKLEKLLDVKERWDAEEARKAYVAALAAFKCNPPTLVKDRKVDHRGGRYNYAPLSQVASLVAEALASYGFTHGWAVAQEGGKVTVTCTLTHERGHSESVTITGPHDDTGSKNAIQQIGSAISYLQRYTLLSITGLAAQDQDDDGISSSPPRTPPPASNRQPSPSQPLDERAEYLERLAGFESVDDFNDELTNLPADAPDMQKGDLLKAARSQGYDFDRELGQFVDPAPPDDGGDTLTEYQDLLVDIHGLDEWNMELDILHKNATAAELAERWPVLKAAAELDGYAYDADANAFVDGHTPDTEAAVPSGQMFSTGQEH